MSPVLYVETSIVSYLAARPSRDIFTLSRQRITDTWWQQSRGNYDLATSLLVIDEAGAGDQGAAARRLELLDGLRLIEINLEVTKLADFLVAEGIVPEQAYADGVHIAVCAIHNVDFLLTWNCRHINNPHTQRDIGRICRLQGYEPPVICSPDDLVEV